MRVKIFLTIFLTIILIDLSFGLIKESNGVKVEANFSKQINKTKISINVLISNLESFEKNLTIYSYIHRGANSVTGSWTENKKEITLINYETRQVKLFNDLKKPVSGIYSYKVRVIYNDSKIDLSSKVLINQSFKNFKTVNDEIKIYEPLILVIIGFLSLYFGLKKL